MDQLFSSLKGFFKAPKAKIDNQVYRLHYRATFVILIAFSLMVTSKQYFGDPIDCISKDEIITKVLDTYCWIHTTFSIENAWNKQVGSEVPYPGVDKTTPNEKRVHHAYYQWVCFVLFFQGLAFYVPRWLWKAYLGSKLDNLTKGLNTPLLDDEKHKKVIAVANYLRNFRGKYDSYFYFYTVTEFLNFLNVLVQMYVMDCFLGGEFSTYGLSVIKFTEWDWKVRFDPMMKVFPRLTKCTFHRFGPSGDVQKHDAMCILPINIVNEKIYVFLWFWFYFIAIITTVALIYRVCTILFTHLRIRITQSRCRVVDRYELAELIKRGTIGDWFFLDLCSRNMDPLNFKELVQELHNKAV